MPKSRKTRDPWAHADDPSAKLKELLGAESDAQDWQPYRMRLVDPAAVQAECGGKDQDLETTREMLACLNKAYRDSLVRGLRDNRPRIADWLMPHDGVYKRAAQRFYEGVLLLSNSKRWDCTFLAYSDRMYEHPLIIPPEYMAVTQKPRNMAIQGLPNLQRLQWGILNCSPALSQVPSDELLIGGVSSSGFALAWCFHSKPIDENSIPPRMPYLFSGTHANAFDQVGRLVDAFCYEQVSAVYSAVQPLVATHWTETVPGAASVNPVERWLCDPNGETLRRAQWFVRPLKAFTQKGSQLPECSTTLSTHDSQAQRSANRQRKLEDSVNAALQKHGSKAKPDAIIREVGMREQDVRKYLKELADQDPPQYSGFSKKPRRIHDQKDHISLA